jgi:hypothetical protein
MRRMGRSGRPFEDCGIGHVDHGFWEGSSKWTGDGLF